MTFSFQFGRAWRVPRHRSAFLVRRFPGRPTADMKTTTLLQQLAVARKITFASIVLGMSLLWLGPFAQAEPPSHDPSRVMRNTDGRYWISGSKRCGAFEWRRDDVPAQPERLLQGTWPRRLQ
jgi:hypothetical protein